MPYLASSIPNRPPFSMPNMATERLGNLPSTTGGWKPIKIGSVEGRIKYAREARGWTKAKLAKEMGVSKATISDWESGKIQNLKMAHLVKLSDKTGFAIPWLAVNRQPAYKRLLESEDEFELNELFRGMTPETRKEMLSIARRYHKTDHGERPTAVVPYPPAKVHA